jgi:hypothetical protein
MSVRAKSISEINRRAWVADQQQKIEKRKSTLSMQVEFGFGQTLREPSRQIANHIADSRGGRAYATRSITEPD